MPSRDFSVGVRTALGRLGYELVPARASGAAPDARIVAAGRVRRLRQEASEPVILFGGSRSRDVGDPRVIGVIRPPAELRELYAMLQRALEAHPRAAPRIPAALPARSLRGSVDAPGAILSLSEKGCLLRSTIDLPWGSSVQLQFALPNGGMVYTRAEPRHRLGKETGLEFRSLSDASRAAISEFVIGSLTQCP